MKLEIRKAAAQLTVVIVGSIDTVTAPELEKRLNEQLEGVTELLLDFSAVDYVSSAGLRIIMASDQHMEEVAGKMTIRHINDDVKEVFEMTGFDTLLNLE